MQSICLLPCPRIRPLLLVLTALVLSLATAGSAMAQKIKLVNANTLSLRESADTDSGKVDTLITYQPVELLETKGETWCKVRTKDKKVGWVLSKYLSDTAYLMVNHRALNVRRGPGQEYSVIMHYSTNFPLRVLDVASNGYIFVMDYEGDKGWIHPNLVRLKPQYVITVLDKCNVRKGIGTEEEIVFNAEAGAMFEVIKEKDGWLHVRHPDGDEGWISAKIVFGWLDEPRLRAKDE